MWDQDQEKALDEIQWIYSEEECSEGRDGGEIRTLRNTRMWTGLTLNQIWQLLELKIIYVCGYVWMFCKFICWIVVAERVIIFIVAEIFLLKNACYLDLKISAVKTFKYYILLKFVNSFFVRYFVEEKPIWEMDSGLVLPSEQLKVDNSVAQYTGGIVQVQNVFSFYYFLKQSVFH